MQDLGMVRAFMNDGQVRDFVRILQSMPFLPVNRIGIIYHIVLVMYHIIYYVLESLLEELKAFSIDANSPYCESFSKIKPVFLEYFERVWMKGHFPPQLWNLFNKSKSLTNNPQEGFNSKINKMIKSHGPNPNLLVIYCCNILIDSDLKAIQVKNGNLRQRPKTAITLRLERQREELQKDYNKGSIPEMQFLKAIGAISVKSMVKSKVVAAPDIEGEEAAPVPVIDDSLRSLRNSRIISEASSGDEVSGLPPRGLPAAFLKSRRHEAKKCPRATKTARQVARLKCPRCSKGFQFARNPPLQLKCRECPVYVHLRCMEEGFDEETFLCQQCSPLSTLDDVEVPANTDCSDELASTADISVSPQLAYSTCPESWFVERMRFLGFKRSRTQLNTPTDGNCALHGVLDGYNNITGENSMFPRENTTYLRWETDINILLNIQLISTLGPML